jgi:hypothetical protein
MQPHGIQGAKCGGKLRRTSIADLDAHRRADLFQRNFVADALDRLWVGDLSRWWGDVVYLAF